jgi:hypothetical protein
MYTMTQTHIIYHPGAISNQCRANLKQTKGLASNLTLNKNTNVPFCLKQKTFLTTSAHSFRLALIAQHQQPANS